MVKFDVDKIDIFLYENIEFFFSIVDLEQMMKIKQFSYEDWATTSVLLKETKFIKDETKVNPDFNYNIMTDDAYKNIIEILKTTKDDIINKNKEGFNTKISQIVKLYDDLYYYEEVYVHAHFVFNKIRKLIEDGIIDENTTVGGGLSLKDFKERIRQKIRLITNQ
uniref:Uncharacterized protein n=1 Tax=viral metagenome TaxID=1070528 RepID=A0A6C0ETS7_9ZZZZ